MIQFEFSFLVTWLIRIKNIWKAVFSYQTICYCHKLNSSPVHTITGTEVMNKWVLFECFLSKKKSAKLQEMDCLMVLKSF